MRMFLRFILSITLCLGILSCGTSQTVVSNFKLRPYSERQLSNGLKVLLVEDRSLPAFTVALLLKAGSSQDPNSKMGLANIVARVLDKGTRKRTAIELADSFGQIGANFSASVYKDYTLISAKSLSFHQDLLLSDFSEIITGASFKKPEFLRAKQKTLSQLQRSVDDPGGFASKLFDSFLFEKHPYSKKVQGNVASVKGIKHKDIIRYYLKNYRPNNAILAIVGKFDKNIMEKLEEKFGSWKKRDIAKIEFPKTENEAGLKLQLIEKDDLKQTQIRMGHFGIRRDNPDFLKVRVANTILGGAFASRLMDEIRDKRGLTYSINSNFDARLDHGPFTISTFTRHEKVGETITGTLDVLTKFRSKGVTEKEVQEAKGLLLGSFPRALETAERLATNLMILRFYGISDAYLESYLDNISNISVADVNGAIKKYIHPDKMKILVYSSKKVKSQLKGIGQLKINNFSEFQ